MGEKPRKAQVSTGPGTPSAAQLYLLARADLRQRRGDHALGTARDGRRRVHLDSHAMITRSLAAAPPGTDAPP
jgi:hypothetical protein